MSDGRCPYGGHNASLTSKMRLYKIVAPERIDVLRRALIRFTQPADLNDPFEARPRFGVVRSTSELRAAMRHDAVLRRGVFDAIDPGFVRGALKLMPGWMTGWLASAIAGEVFGMLERGVFTDDFRAKFSAALTSGVGILSLTERREDLLMWSHYGASHRGFAIGFDAQSLEAAFAERRRALPSKGNGGRYRLRSISYPEEPRVYSVSEYFVDDWDDMYFIKAPIWRYEREWRMVAYLKDAELCVGSATNAVHLFRFPPECVQEVVLGAKISPDDERALAELVRDDERYRHVRLRRAVLKDDLIGPRLETVDVDR
jgi:hypothetical protein